MPTVQAPGRGAGKPSGSYGSLPGRLPHGLTRRGSRLEAMGTLAISFEQLMSEQINDMGAPRGLSVYSFGGRMPSHALRADQVQAILHQPDHASRRGAPVRAAETLAREYTQTRDVTRALQEGMRLMALGVDFHQYQRFTQLTPGVGYTYGNPEDPRFSVEPALAVGLAQEAGVDRCPAAVGPLGPDRSSIHLLSEGAVRVGEDLRRLGSRRFHGNPLTSLRRASARLRLLGPVRRRRV